MPVPTMAEPLFKAVDTAVTASPVVMPSTVDFKPLTEKALETSVL